MITLENLYVCVYQYLLGTNVDHKCIITYLKRVLYVDYANLEMRIKWNITDRFI